MRILERVQDLGGQNLAENLGEILASFVEILQRSRWDLGEYLGEFLVGGIWYLAEILVRYQNLAGKKLAEILAKISGKILHGYHFLYVNCYSTCSYDRYNSRRLVSIWLLLCKPLSNDCSDHHDNNHWDEMDFILQCISVIGVTVVIMWEEVVVRIAQLSL